MTYWIQTVNSWSSEVWLCEEYSHNWLTKNSLSDMTPPHLKCQWWYLMPSSLKSCCVCFVSALTHWGRVTHIGVITLIIIGSDNGLSPSRRQAIIWTDDRILLIRTFRTYFSEIVSEIHTFSFKKMHFKMSSGKWRPPCLGLNVLRRIDSPPCLLCMYIYKHETNTVRMMVRSKPTTWECMHVNRTLDIYQDSVLLN